MPDRVVGYFTAWGVTERGYQARDIPASLLTHINYTFADVSSAGECVLELPETTMEQFRELKRVQPHLRILLSIGGWTGSRYLSDAVATHEARERFVDSCLQILQRYSGLFDGFDLDWEYPGGGGMEENRARPDDRAHLTRCMELFRSRLHELGGDHWLLTMAIPANERVLTQFDLAGLAPVLDWFNLMAYDFAGAWSNQTGLHAPLYPDPSAPDAPCIVEIVDRVTRILPSDKLVLGIPFYGRGWVGVPKTEHGLYQPYETIPVGDADAGCFSYRALTQLASPDKQFWNPSAKAHWFYDERERLMISYETPESIAEKWRCIQEKRLGGAMVWELSLDDEQHTLLHAVAAGRRSYYIHFICSNSLRSPSW